MTQYYTDERNAQIVIALLKAHGIRKVVASPGTTNLPITGSLLSDSFFEVYSAADERSAAYLACGLSYDSGEAVALSCTGATASRNYLPGLTEAWYRKLPVIAITSTPSLAEVGHLLPQCIDRSSSQKDVARISVSLPPVKDDADVWDCEIKVNKAILEATRAGGGPVHINIATSYTKTFHTRELPPVRVIRRFRHCCDIPQLDQKKKVAVFVGAHKPFSQAETESLEQFVKTHKAVLLSDHTSAYKGIGRVLSALVCSQPLSTKPSLFAELRPDLVVHIGEISSDYATQDFIRASGAPVWRVSEDGEVRDRFKRLQYVFEMPEQEFFQTLSKAAHPQDNGYLHAWQAYLEELTGMIPDLPFSNTWIAQQMSSALPSNSTVHFGILTTLRSWSYFELEPSIRTAANVGGFGIDGCLSALIGASLADTRRTYFALLGDLAFFYDLNSVGNRHLGCNVRIVLVNNGGGVEFRMRNNTGTQFDGPNGDYVVAAGHYGNKSAKLVKHMAEDLGFKYLSARSKEEFLHNIKEFTSATDGDKPMLFECFTEMEEDAKAAGAMYDIDRSVVATMAARMLPQGLKSSIKRVLNVGT